MDEAVSVTDIARAARTSPRSLREGFRVHLNTTPQDYLRRLRLDQAHRDLLAISDGRAVGTVNPGRREGVVRGGAGGVGQCCGAVPVVGPPVPLPGGGGTGDTGPLSGGW